MLISPGLTTFTNKYINPFIAVEFRLPPIIMCEVPR